MFFGMKLLSFVAGLFAGFLLGVGVFVVYMRWRLTRQLTVMQENIGDMFEMVEEEREG